jgi:hypothetical protein
MGNHQGVKKINDPKKALKLLIGSMEKGTNYNIIKFGTSFQKFYKKPVEHTEKNFLATKKLIKGINADLGGTELQTVVKDILSDSYGDSLVNVFIITDGQISYHDEIVKSIKEKNKNIRFFTIGIGSDADRSLCEKIAFLGGGICNMIVDVGTDIDDLSEVILNQYKLSRLDYIITGKFVLPEDSRIITTYTNNPILSCDYTNTIIRVPIKEITSGQLKLTFSYETLKTKKTDGVFKLDFKNIKRNRMIETLFACKIIKNIDDYDYSYKSINEIELSKTHRVLSNKTAFLIVDETVRTKGDLEKITVPHVYNEAAFESYRALSTSGMPMASMSMSASTSSYKKSAGPIQSQPLTYSDMDTAKKAELDKDDDILDFVNFDGSFKMDKFIFDLIGTTEEELNKLSKNKNKTKVFNQLVYDYLTKLNERKYDIILQKLKKFIDGIGDSQTGGYCGCSMEENYFNIKRDYLALKSG